MMQVVLVVLSVALLSAQAAPNVRGKQILQLIKTAALPLRVRSVESDPDGVVAEVKREDVEDEQALEEVQELEERAGPKCVQMGGKEYPVYSQIQVESRICICKKISPSVAKFKCQTV